MAFTLLNSVFSHSTVLYTFHFQLSQPQPSSLRDTTSILASATPQYTTWLFYNFFLKFFLSNHSLSWSPSSLSLRLFLFIYTLFMWTQSVPNSNIFMPSTHFLSLTKICSLSSRFHHSYWLHFFIWMTYWHLNSVYSKQNTWFSFSKSSLVQLGKWHHHHSVMKAKKIFRVTFLTISHW